MEYITPPLCAVESPTVVAVEGPIGAGKTTYINMLSEQLTESGWNVIIVKEPVDEWIRCGILDLFYKDPVRWGYHFQTKAFYDRVMANVRAYEKYLSRPPPPSGHGGGHTDRSIFILERSPFSDRIFMKMLYKQGTISKLEWDHHVEWGNMWMKLMPYKINLFIYLEPGVDVCMSRLRERSRSEEVGVKRDYQVELIKRHNKIFASGTVVLSDSERVPCVTVSTTENYRDDKNVQIQMRSHFESTVLRIGQVDAK